MTMTESEIREALAGLGNGPGWRAFEQLLDEAVETEMHGAALPDANDGQRAHQCGRLAQAIGFRDVVKALKGGV